MTYNTLYNKPFLNDIKKINERYVKYRNEINYGDDLNGYGIPQGKYSTYANTTYSGRSVRDQGLNPMNTMVKVMGGSAVVGQYEKDDTESEVSETSSDTYTSSISSSENDGGNLLDDVEDFVGLGKPAEERLMGGTVSDDLTGLLQNPNFHMLLDALPELMGGQLGVEPDADNLLQNINQFQAPFKIAQPQTIAEEVLGLGVSGGELPVDKSQMKSNINAVGGKKPMKPKKEKKPRKPTKWTEFLKSFKKEHPEMKLKDAMKHIKANNLYKK
jgi:hypothetical protein